MPINSCPRCGSLSFVKAGAVKHKNGEKTQLYRCNKCKYRFRYKMGYDFRKKVSREIVEFAIKLSESANPAYSARDIAAMIWKRFDVKVSHVAVLNWIPCAPSSVDSIIDVPCFKCLLNKLVNPYYCNPGVCSQLWEWLFSEVQIEKKNRG